MTVELAYDFDGPDEAPIVVLLHAIGTSRAIWDGLLTTLTQHFRVLRIDARGHGASPASSDSTITTIADLGDDVLAVLDRLGIERAHVAGSSLGAMTAMWLAVHHPGRVRRLALLCSSAFPGDQQRWLARAQAVRAGDLDAIADPIVARWTTPTFAAANPDVVRQLRNQLVATDADSYAQCCELLAELDLRGDLSRVKASALVVWGDQDHALPRAHSELIAARIAGARPVGVGPAGHLPMVEVPDVVGQLLLDHFGPVATLAAGYRTRRAVLGDAHVDRATARTTSFTADFQEFITRYAWGEVWSRPGLARRDRSIATLAALVALGADGELAMHVRAAIGNGLSADEIGEVLLNTAVYAGLPRANHAFSIAQATLAEMDAPSQG
jgi:3-oxoadipate enol-lactonase/4-carboxymuconolactone decarboxylase